MATEELLPSIAESNIGQDSYAHLVQRFNMRTGDLIHALNEVNFYIELGFIAVVLLLARVFASRIRKRVRDALKKKPTRHLDPDFIDKPLSLVRPVLAFFMFTFGKVAFELLDLDSGCLDAAIQLSLAYIFAKCVLVVVQTKFVARFIAWVIMLVAALRAMHVMKSINIFLESLAFDLGNFHVSMLGLLHGIVVLVVVFWLATALSQALESYLRRSTALSYNAREITVKCFKIFIYFMAMFITLTAVGVDLTAFAVFGGALGVGVGLGLQNLTSNFVSSVTLLMEKSIKINDLIEVNNFTGWVRKLNTRYALIETLDGREVMVPNQVMVSTDLTNWTHTDTKARIDIKVTVSYTSDAVKARELMLEAVAENEFALKDPAPACTLREFGDNGNVFNLCFWIADVRKGRSTPQSDVMFAILRKFQEAGIIMSQPTAAATPNV